MDAFWELSLQTWSSSGCFSGCGGPSLSVEFLSSTGGGLDLMGFAPENPTKGLRPPRPPEFCGGVGVDSMLVSRSFTSLGAAVGCARLRRGGFRQSPGPCGCWSGVVVFRWRLMHVSHLCGLSENESRSYSNMWMVEQLFSGGRRSVETTPSISIK